MLHYKKLRFLKKLKLLESPDFPPYDLSFHRPIVTPCIHTTDLLIRNKMFHRLQHFHMQMAISSGEFGSSFSIHCSIQKRLGAYYESFSDKKQRLYYERRSKQFGSSNNIEKVRIVTISTQWRSFCGMFLDVPLMSSRYHGRLYKEYSEKVFNSNELMLYYMAAFSLCKIEYFIRNKSIESLDTIC